MESRLLQSAANKSLLYSGRALQQIPVVLVSLPGQDCPVTGGSWDHILADPKTAPIGHLLLLWTIDSFALASAWASGWHAMHLNSSREFEVNICVWVHGCRPISGRLTIGFCFSFPVQHLSMNSGRLMTWVKGFECAVLSAKTLPGFLMTLSEDRYGHSLTPRKPLLPKAA